MSNICKRSYLLVAAATAVAIPVTGISAATFNNYWSTAGDGNYNLASNWSQGVVPFSDDTDKHTVYINGGPVVTLGTLGHTADVFYLNRSLGGAPAPTGETTLRVLSGGSLSAVRFRPGGGSITSIEGGSITGTTEVAIGYQSSATLNLSAGSLIGTTAIGHGGSGVLNLSGTGYGSGNLVVGGQSATSGEVNQIGGTWAAGTLTIGGGGTGTYNLSNGVVTASSRLRIGDTTPGTLNISGGSLTANAYTTYLGGQTNAGGIGELVISSGTISLGAGLALGGVENGGTMGGSGTLRIVGAGGSLSVGGSGLDVHSNSTLNFQIGAGGVSTILVDPSSAGSSTGASLLAGLLDIDLLDGYVSVVGETFDLVSTSSTYTGTNGGGTYTNGLDITNLTLAPEDEPFWSMGVVSENGRTILRIENIAAIPEPAGLALLGLAIPAMMRRGRMV